MLHRAAADPGKVGDSRVSACPTTPFPLEHETADPPAAGAISHRATTPPGTAGRLAAGLLPFLRDGGKNSVRCADSHPVATAGNR